MASWEEYLDMLKKIWIEKDGLGYKALADIKPGAIFVVEFTGGSFAGKKFTMKNEGGEWKLEEGDSENKDLTLMVSDENLYYDLSKAKSLEEFINIYKSYVSKGAVSFKAHTNFLGLARKGYTKFGKTVGLL